MKKIIAYPIQGILFLLLIFSFLVIIEIHNLQDVEALPPQAKVPIDTPAKDRTWDLDQDKLKNYIAENPAFSNQSLIEIIGNVSNRDWAIDGRFSYLEFIYDGKGIVMIYNASKNDLLV